MLESRTYRLAKVLIALVAVALMVYVALDAIYFHVFFQVGNALFAGLALSLVLIVGVVLLLLIQIRESSAQSS